MINAPLERVNLHLGKESSRAELVAEIQQLQVENEALRARLARTSQSMPPTPNAALRTDAGHLSGSPVCAGTFAGGETGLSPESKEEQAKRIPAPPPNLDTEKLFSGLSWHQRWQVFQGVYTPGHNSIEEMCDALQVPGDLTGKRVLDIGAWNGCLALECERRGASEVVALEPANPEHAGFDRLSSILGFRRSRWLAGTIYDLDPSKLGHFDVVFCCGVLYHLRYPLLGLDNIRRVCTGVLYLETLLSDHSLEQRYAGTASAPLWEFYRFNEVHNDYSNWFGPTLTAVVQGLKSAGFAVAVAQYYKGAGRGVFKTRVKEGVPEFLAIPSGEGFYYDTLVSHLLGKQRPGTEV
jgi:tRNA (mo5U34)-methyltransferase